MAQLRVTDAGGTTDTISVTITAGNPPTPMIDSPSSSLTWAVGDTIAFSGSAVDCQGDPIPASGLSWQLNIRHCSRIQTGSATRTSAEHRGGDLGHFIAPDHDWPSHLELLLTATDADGLSASKTVTSIPRPST